MIVDFARPEDADTIVAVWREAAARLIHLGQPLWRVEDFDCAFADLRIERREVVVARIDSGVVGVMLAQPEDRDFWPDRCDGQAIYLHKIAVRDTARGRGVMVALIAWAAAYGRTRGRPLLRLDCEDRPKLCALYEGLGFRPLDRREALGHKVIRFERALD